MGCPTSSFPTWCAATGRAAPRSTPSDGASFVVEKGELAVILGASGAGKTTALNILGGMDSATLGHGRPWAGATSATPARTTLVMYRRADVGFVFQFYNLVPNLTALENVELAAQICPDSLDAAQTLEKVGLAERLDNFPAQALRRRAAARLHRARHSQEPPSSCSATSPQERSTTSPGKQIPASSCRTPADATASRSSSSRTTRRSPTWPTASFASRADGVTDMTVNPDPRPIAEIEW